MTSYGWTPGALVQLSGFLLLLMAIDPAQSTVVLSCPIGWTLKGAYCYKVYSQELTWTGAEDICKQDGAHLAQVKDAQTNSEISQLALSQSVTSYWIGLNRISATGSSTSQFAEWSNGMQWSLYNGFWSHNQPDTGMGNCVYVSHFVEERFRWSLGTSSYRCPNGVWISPSRTCDGQNDCGDGSDEMECGSCRSVIESSSGEISSSNYPGQYSPNADCKWTIVGPVSSVIEIEFLTFQTEAGVDEVIIFGGGKAESNSVTLQRFSGDLNLSGQLIRSTNNLMIIKFTSDDVQELNGFKLTWRAVQTLYPGSGIFLTSENFFQSLRSFGYPSSYQANQETVYILTSQQARGILHLEILDLDPGDGDYIYVRDGSDPDSPLLESYSSVSTGKRHVFSTGPAMYIFYKTAQSASNSNRGFDFQYKTGCSVTLEGDAGEIASPGYPVVNYPDFQDCKWTIQTASGRGITLQFDNSVFDVHSSDSLRAFAGLNTSSRALHPGDGLSLNQPPADITVDDGRLLLQFHTSAIVNARGFRATYSIGCPSPSFNTDTTVQPVLTTYNYGVTLSVSCGVGFVFDSDEFYVDGLLGRQSQTSVSMTCQYGGSWNVQRIPNCIRKYCGLPPAISNGYIQTATGSQFGSQATYGCVNGYILSGQQTIACDSNGNWGTPPMCIAQTCPALNLQTTNAESLLIFRDGTSVFSTYLFSCAAGYQLEGSPTLFCQENGLWSSSIPSCQRRVCVVPTISKASVRTNSQTALYGDTLTVECNTGYVIVGTQNVATTITCQSSLTFGTLPSCEVSAFDYCATNPCSVNETCASQIGTYECSCKEGYSFQDGSCQDVDECQSGTSNCEQSCSNTVGSYECDCNVGYSLFRSNGLNGYFIPSGETGLRTGDVYHINHTCVPNQCPSYTPANGFVTNPQSSYNVNDSLIVECNLGYVPLSGIDTAVCTESGQWNSRVPFCAVARCQPDSLGSLVNPPSLIVPTGPVNYGASVILVCQVPGQGTFNRTRSCSYNPGTLSYQLQGDSYECGVIDCGPPELYLPKGAIAVFSSGHSTVYGSSFVFNCEFPYFQSSGLPDSSVVCGANGQWNFGNLGCVYGSCPEPGSTPFSKANVEGYGFRNLTTYTCDLGGFEPVPNTPLQCVSNNDGTALVWNASAPVCVDVSPPSFTLCIQSPITVPRYASVPLTFPVGSDNLGQPGEIIVSPPFLLPNQPIAENFNFTYTIKDYVGLTATGLCFRSLLCQIFCSLDETAPTVECPASVILTVSPNRSSEIVFNTSLVSASDDTGIQSVIFSPPSFTGFYINRDRVVDVTAIVSDIAGNQASCSFQLYIQEAECSENRLQTPRNAFKTCSQTISGGYNCAITCIPNFYFYDAYPNEEFVSTCEPGQNFSPSYIPSCSESFPIGRVASAIFIYETDDGPGITSECEASYASSIETILTNLRPDLTIICGAQGSIQNIQLKAGSITVNFFSALNQTFILFKLEMLPSGIGAAQYDTCYDSINTDLQGLFTNSSTFLPVRTLSASNCPNITVQRATVSNIEECENNLGTRLATTQKVCLKCPPGTSVSDEGGCDLCPVGTYWVETVDPFLGQCALCPPGQSTASRGATGSEFCKVTCTGNFVSMIGVPPCFECTGNTYRYNKTHCKECPLNTLALRSENPLTDNCTDTCNYVQRPNADMLSPPRSTYGGSVPQCQEICEAWDSIFIGSNCVGFTHDKLNSICTFFDQLGPYVNDPTNETDLYIRECDTDNLENCYCAPACPAGSYSETGYEPICKPCPAGYTSIVGSTRCTECASNETSVAGVGVCFDATSIFCDPSPCLNGGVCLVENHDFYCECDGFRGRRCETPFNACFSLPCNNNGDCTPGTGNSFTCTCYEGFTGQQCEANINDCPPNSCSNRGTCIDGIGNFTCLCVDGFTGDSCETRQQLACDRLACDPAGTDACIPLNEIYAQCSCKNGYTGPTCSELVDSCVSGPCQNGGTCVNGLNTYACQCLTGFRGNNCELPELTCAQQSCSNSVTCEEDYRTGLPTCVCSPGYMRGLYCSYLFSSGYTFEGDMSEETNATIRTCQIICNVRGDSCAGFSYVPIPELSLVERGMCKFYTRINNKVLDSAAGATAVEKVCTAQEGQTFYSNWFNPRGFDNGGSVTLVNSVFSFQEVICQSSVPLKAECRLQSGGALPSEVSCGFNGVSCVNSASSNCTDLEVRFLCASSRVFRNDLCQLQDVCSELQPCVRGTCFPNATEPSLYQCLCPPGFEGAQCQHEINECLVVSGALACQNGATCVDEFLGISCVCAPGFTGPLCEVNIDDCVQNLCDPTGTDVCVDVIDAYTCICKPGYTGVRCEVDIDDCLTQPCLHGGNCTDQINGFSCVCAEGWTDSQCDTIVDQCTLTTPGPCGNGVNCQNLFQDFYCQCPSPTFGKICESTEDICANANPCINGATCKANGQTCECVPGTIAGGCHLYQYNTCDGFVCQNGGTCMANITTSPMCSCSTEYTGSQCELHVDNCQAISCHPSAICVDGIAEAFCRCPPGKKGDTCFQDISDDFDICLSSSTDSTGAELPYPAPYNDTGGFTLKMWVKYSNPGLEGTFFTLFYSRSGYSNEDRISILSIDHKGLQLNPTLDLPYVYKPINDGNWHFIIVTWTKATGHIDLVVDFVRHGQLDGYAQGLVLGRGGFEPILGTERNSPRSENDFYGCVSDLDMLARALDFDNEIERVGITPDNYLGDVFRWGEFSPYGNAIVSRPSVASVTQCSNGNVDPACASLRDRVAPNITFCPEDIAVTTIYDKAQVSWQEPTFDGAVAISANHQPGTYFGQGESTVVYVGRDVAGNAALCSFSIYINDKFCPDLDPPRGNGNEVCPVSRSTADSFSTCQISCPPVTSRLVESTPDYFTCGPGGEWESLLDSDDLYPTCGRIDNSARLDFKLRLQYTIGVTDCPSIIVAMETKAKQELAQLHSSWQNNICQVADCSDASVGVDCSQLPSTSLNITIQDAKGLLSNGSSSYPAKDVFLENVLDNGLFAFTDIFPSAVLDRDTFTIEANSLCQPGQVVQGDDCVSCGPGTFFNTSVGKCDNCPIGQFQTGYGQLACVDCPQGQTTSRVGSESALLCAPSCPAGQFYNAQASSCEACNIGFYQNEAGQFQCKPCPIGQVTGQTGSVSPSSCAESCDSGEQLLASGICSLCPNGTYRDKDVDSVCTSCPSAYTTPGEGSINRDNCTVLRCPAGSRANDGNTACVLCQQGEYQPLTNQRECLKCQDNFTTAGTEIISADQCTRYCPSGQEVDSGLCIDCEIGFYKDNADGLLGVCQPCPIGYLTVNEGSKTVSDCSRRNCTAGYYISPIIGGGEECVACSQGTYQPLPYQNTCLPCPGQTYTRGTAATSIDLCEAYCESGFELINGTCEKCPRGYYKDNGDSFFGVCLLCPGGLFITPSTAATSVGECNIRNCSAGSYINSLNQCQLCPIGYYQPDKWQTSCIQCPPDSTTNSTGSLTSAECFLSCPRGQEEVNGTCLECPVGYYKDIVGISSCTICPTGFITVSSGATSVGSCSKRACDPGYYRNVFTEECFPCTYGQYQPLKWQSACLVCPSGLTFITGAVDENSCVLDCDVGTEYAAATNSCVPCPQGYYRDKTTAAQTTCVMCPAEFITASAGSQLASDCNIRNCTTPGEYRNPQSNICELCPIGTYNTEKWQDACTDCPDSFTTKSTGRVSVTECYRDCPSGQQVVESTNTCEDCGRGFYRDSSTSWTCQPCPTALTTLGTRSTSVSNCNVSNCLQGTFFNTSAAACENCPLNTYQPENDQRSCLPCPEFTSTAQTGSTTISQCLRPCEAGLQNCSNYATCANTDDGGFSCTCISNYVGTGDVCIHVCDDTEPYCLNGGTCSKTGAQLCSCGEAYEGPRCEARIAAEQLSDNTNEIILGSVVGGVCLVLILILLLIFVVKRLKGSSRYEKDSIGDSSYAEGSTMERKSRSSMLVTRANTQAIPGASLNYSDMSLDPAVYLPKVVNGQADMNQSYYSYDNAANLSA